MARSTSTINADQIKTEVLHTFDSIDGELNISTGDGVEMARRPVDIKTELDSEPSFDSSNGNIGLKVEGNSDSPTVAISEVDDAAELRIPEYSLFNVPEGVACDVAAVDQNSNITDTEMTKDLMVVGKSVETKTGSGSTYNTRRKSVNSSVSEFNNSRVSNQSGINMSGSSDSGLILRISEDSSNSDTDEVDSDSNDCITDAADEQNGPGELPGEEQQGSVTENGEDDESIDETLHDNSDTLVSRKNRSKRKKKANLNQSTLHKFLVPRQSMIQESSEIIKGNHGSLAVPRISISHLILNSCVNCNQGYTSFGVKTKKCRDCGKRMKFNCFICEKLYNTHTGIYAHVVQFHQFSLRLFNEKIHGFIKSICSKCKGTFDSPYSTCSKCNLNLKFGCLICNELRETRPRIYAHVVQSHADEFVLSPETADTDSEMSTEVNTENSLLKDDEAHKDASSIDKNIAASKNSDPKQQRKVRFQLDNAKANEENRIEDISKSEVTVKTLCPTPRYPAKRRGVGAKTAASTETLNKSNSEITDKISEPAESKQTVSNRRKSINANLNVSKSKKSNEVISKNEDTSKIPTGPKQQVAAVRRSNRVNLNSSEANSDSEATNKNELSTKTCSAVPSTSGRRKSIQGQMKTNKSDEDIAPKNKPVGSQINPRRSSRISLDNNSMNNERTSVDEIIVAAEISEPKKITNKRRRSRSMTDISEPNDNLEITFVDVHPVPSKIESKEQIATGKRRSFRTMSNSSDTGSHDDTPNVLPVAAKRRNIRNMSINADSSSSVENGYGDETPAVPKTFASKPPVGQGRRRSLRAMLDTSETNSPTDIATPETTAPAQQVANKRRKSRDSINAEFDNSRSEISVDESNTEITVAPNTYNCSFCQKSFLVKKACKKHEVICKEGPDLVCDICSYATKYAPNLKKHKLIMHGQLKESKMIEADTPRVLLSGKVEYGALYTIDSTCTDILSRMEAHCPNCKEDSKMKPNDSNCLKCKSKLLLTCLKCSRHFSDFLAIFNHLYRECTEKEYHCARCSFTTTSLDTIQDHVTRSEHANVKSNDAPFVFAAQPQAPVTVSDAKANLKVGYKTRAQSRVKPKEKVAVEAGEDQPESKLKKCPKCNAKVPSLVKHLAQCKAELRCPFCSFVAQTKYYMRKHLAGSHSNKSHTVRFQTMFWNDNNRASKARPDIQEMMRSYCKICDKLKESVPFMSKCEACETDLEYHCTKCPARFELRERLRKHVWTHANSVKYLRCEGCFKKFAFAENLRMHEKVCTVKPAEAAEGNNNT